MAISKANAELVIRDILLKGQFGCIPGIPLVQLCKKLMCMSSITGQGLT